MRRTSAPLFRGGLVVKKWWPGTGSNRRRRPFQGRALPLSYLALAFIQTPHSGICQESEGVRLSHLPVQGSLLPAGTSNSNATQV